MKDENSALHAKAEVAKPLAVAIIAIGWQAAISGMNVALGTKPFYFYYGVVAASLITFISLLRLIFKNISRKQNAELAAMAAELEHDDNERTHMRSLERMAAAMEANCSKPKVKYRHRRKHSKRRTTKVVNVIVVNNSR